MHLNINDKFQITEYNEISSLLKVDDSSQKTPFSIHLLKDKFKFLILSTISFLELSENESTTLNQMELEKQGVHEFEKIKIDIKENNRSKEYLVVISEKSNEIETKKNTHQQQDNIDTIKSPVSTSDQFERFFTRIDQVNEELDKRNKINEELISLNKQLLLKDQLLERNKNNVEALLNNNLQAFVLVDTFYLSLIHI